MAINYKQEMDKLIHKKLGSIIKNEIIIVKNKLVIQFKREPTKDFYLAFVQNIREIEDTQIYNLYIDKLNNNFGHQFEATAKIFAAKYQQNQLKQLINQSIKQTFDDEFKQQLNILFIKIAQETLQVVPY